MSDPFSDFRGTVDDRFLDDQRFPVEFRLQLARMLALGEISPSDAALTAKQFLAQDLAQGEMTEEMSLKQEEPPEPTKEGDEAQEFLPPSDEPPITPEQAGAAQVEMIEATKAGAITTAASLLPPEEEETPPPPEASEPPPPGERHGPFLVQADRRGNPTEVLVELPDGVYRPLGIWLHEEHPDLSPDGLYRMLTEMGLPATYAELYARHRSYARPTEEVLREVWGEDYEGSAFHAAEEMEKKHWETKDSFSRAFIEAQRKKEKR